MPPVSVTSQAKKPELASALTVLAPTLVAPATMLKVAVMATADSIAAGRSQTLRRCFPATSR